jgi:hypothetical protein
VKELVVLRDKQTHKSKGSAFVWYSTAAQADRVRVLGQFPLPQWCACSLR